MIKNDIQQDRPGTWHSLFHRPSNHEPVIDGIRAIAILWVLVLHIVFFHFGTFPEQILRIFKAPATKWISQGALGVDLFFVISGFLIGTILLKELRRSETINMRRFYSRRFLRLIPVYIVAMAMGAYFLRNIPKEAILTEIPPSGHIENAWANLLYVNNFLSIRDQYMGWCWSLAIEEQFYMIAPIFLLLIVGKSKYPIRWMLGLLLLSGFIRLGVILSYDFVPPFNDTPDSDSWALRFDTIYDKPYVRYGGLLAGVLGAHCSTFHRDALEQFFGRHVVASTVGITSLVVIAWISTLSFGSDWFTTIPKLAAQLLHSHSRDVFSVAVLMIIWLGIHGQGILAAAIRGLLSAKVLYPIAQLSYSMYLVHEMFMLWMFPRTTPLLKDSGLSVQAILWINGIGVTLLTVSVATILYVFVERPCMNWRNSARFRRLSGTPDQSQSDSTPVQIPSSPSKENNSSRQKELSSRVERV